MTLPPVAVSAPGKVLLAGGYLVLDRAYTGLVCALDARIHAHVQPVPTSNGITLQEIVVQSPQFLHAQWRYGYHTAADNGGIVVNALTGLSNAQLSRNDFVENALAYALTYIASTATASDLTPTIAPAWVTILADDDYYSHGGAGARSNDARARFHQFSTTIGDAHKTGLGSSAALVTAFVAAVLTHYLPTSIFDVSTADGQRRLHNLAQAAHSAAQGKIGSGFDVASAVFGSCRYTRFSPAIFDALGPLGTAGFADRLVAAVDDRGTPEQWDTKVVKSPPVAVPKGLRLVMCDVDCGSKTPGMVKTLLQWRKDRPDEAERIWTDLNAANMDLAAGLTKAGESGSTAYPELADSIQRVRGLLREMSSASKVPVEPPAQTLLLDACTAIPGVLGGVVPGAGGFDALALIIEDSDDVWDQLKQLVSQWKFDGADDSTGGQVHLLQVRQEAAGIQVEDPSAYSAWTQ